MEFVNTLPLYTYFLARCTYNIALYAALALVGQAVSEKIERPNAASEQKLSLQRCRSGQFQLKRQSKCFC
ncbi:unnamed protein product [Acanthoscelides obtectus]|uniref:Uncharacterized protein n=1 Tax=Acanthoscelides obtectus TaxID=200917 RepID=A0A9P0MH41_ACAOB|nr:unnamed protein product [Acanthoscelides obtectus]CAH2016386.1 unnamed protein product [Acanthoscelides obtectus]CAK1646253.1 hypothetical protein AOBTE_LOCUS14532 [Acanthoscelides obtectus]CAK1686165.1 hypothetical protein AOBTE_LOCUS35823 [Acanthoscelides obtectus]